MARYSFSFDIGMGNMFFSKHVKGTGISSRFKILLRLSALRVFSGKTEKPKPGVEVFSDA